MRLEISYILYYKYQLYSTCLGVGRCVKLFFVVDDDDVARDHWKSVDYISLSDEDIVVLFKLENGKKIVLVLNEDSFLNRLPPQSKAFRTLFGTVTI